MNHISNQDFLLSLVLSLLLTTATPYAHAEAAGTHDATFSLHAPHAKSVEVIGSFNFWQTGTVTLAGPDEKGMWRVKVPLPVNLIRIEYVYWVDGVSRQIDPAQPIVQDEFAGDNNVLALP